MANFGTPIVIGTLTSSTSQTSYQVPITAVTGVSDSIVVSGGAGGGGSGAQISAVTDTQGNVYNEYSSAALNQSLSYWQAFDCKPLGLSDIVTVTYASATTQVKDIIIVDCPGVATYSAIDQVPSPTTAVGSHPSITSAVLNQPYELCLFVVQNASPGGAPTGFGSFTQLGSSVQSGSGPYFSVAYQIVTTAAAVNASCTLSTSAAWSAIMVTMLPNMQTQFYQQPFPLSQLNSALAFNPATNQFRVLSSQVSPAVTGSINFTGSQTNITTGPGPAINYLATVNSSTFETTLGGWTSGGATNLTRPGTQAHTGTNAMLVSVTGTGTRGAVSAGVSGFPNNFMPANFNDTVFVSAWVMANTTPARQVQVGVDFYDANTNLLGTVTGNGIQTVVGQWIFISAEVVSTFPATSYARARVQSLSSAIGDAWFADDIVMSNLTTNSQPGQINIYQQFQQQFSFVPDGIPAPLYYMASLSALRRQVPTALPTVLQPGITSNVTVAAPAGSITVQAPYWQQFPFPAILPTPLRFIPAYSGLRTQNTTGNATVYVDGGQATGIVSVSAGTGNSVVTSVSASTNVSVQAPSPPTIVTGPTSNVNVVAPNGVTIETLTGVTTGITVRAISGSINISISGPTCNVSIAAPSGTVRSSVSATSNVSVAAISGSILVAPTAAPANVTVATTVATTVSQHVTTPNVSVASSPGTPSISLAGGSPANVLVATVEKNTTSIPGPTPNITVAAPAGTVVITQVVHGVTSNVSVATSGTVTERLTGPTPNVSVAAPSGTAARSVKLTTINVSVKASASGAGQIVFNGSLVDPDLGMDMLLSQEGKLLDIPVENMLVSADQPPQPQGI